MQAKAMKIVSGALAAVLASALAHGADDEGSVEERIKPIGTVVVASPAPAAPAEAAAATSETAGTEGAVAAEAPAAADATAGGEGAGGASETAAAESAGAAPAGGGDGQALAQASGCLACHQLDTKVVGPAFRDVAAKYKGDAAARDMLIEKVKNGGAGNWGQVPMPPNAHVGVTEIATLVDWILAL